MTLQEVARKTEFSAVWYILLHEYYKNLGSDNEEGVHNSYMLAFHRFRTVQVSSSEFNIKIDCIENEGRTEWYAYCVLENDPIYYDIEFTPWSEVLGMEIEAETFNKFKPHEIVTHCLYEMTFHSFDESETQALREKLKNVVEEINDQYV